MNERPILIVNPRDDPEFVGFVAELVAAAPTGTDALQTGLRQRYPQAVVHAREISGEHAIVWYVYRDGQWIRPGGAGGG